MDLYILIQVLTVWLYSGIAVPVNDTRLLLRKRLLDDYDKNIRPVYNISQKTDVRIGMSVRQIRELNEKHQYLQLNVWMRFFWKDEFLRWDKDQHGGVTMLDYDAEEVWKPDIFLYGSVDDERTGAEIFVNPILEGDHEGNMRWFMPVLIKAACKINVANYPFDLQRCPLIFGSWTKDTADVDVFNSSSSAELTNFIQHSEWELQGAASERNVVSYPCCSVPYSDVTFTIKIKRKPMFYVYNLVFPCVFLIGIGVLMFYLPPESGEKVSLAITVLLALTVFLLVVMENIPASSDVVPTIGIFFLSSIGLLSLSTIMAVFIMNLHFNGEHGNRAPRWARTLVMKYLIRVVCMQQTVRQYKMSAMLYYDTTNILTEGGESVELPKNNQSYKKTKNSWSPVQNGRDMKETHLTANNKSHAELSTSDRILTEILEVLNQQNKFMANKNREEDEINSIRLEWKLIALVLDRLFLLIFAIISITCGLSIFLRNNE